MLAARSLAATPPRAALVRSVLRRPALDGPEFAMGRQAARRSSAAEEAGALGSAVGLDLLFSRGIPGAAAWRR